MTHPARSAALYAALAAGLALATPAAAQAGPPPGPPPMAPGHAMLTVSAEGRSTRAPDLAVFSAGVTSQAPTARAALAANAHDMGAVIAALKRAGTADRDIQTSNLSVDPVYAQPKRQPDGSFDDQGQHVIGYRVSNTVTVRQRQLDDYGQVIDALVTAGANQVNGPDFTLDQPDAATDEARVDAVRKARARADLYAAAAGMKVARIVAIDEDGAVSRPMVMAGAKRMMTAQAATAPVQTGELDLTASVTVRFELAPAG